MEINFSILFVFIRVQKLQNITTRIQCNLKYINSSLVGASLGGLVIIVLVGYFIARMRNNREQAEDQERIVQ